MNKRIRLTIIFSSPDFPYQDVIKWLTPRLSKKFAVGCCQSIDGIWSEDGECERELYRIGSHEKGMKILLSVTLDKLNEAEQEIKIILQDLKNQLNIPLTWVHFEQQEVTAHHFKLQQ